MSWAKTSVGGESYEKVGEVESEVDKIWVSTQK